MTAGVERQASRDRPGRRTGPCPAVPIRRGSGRHSRPYFFWSETMGKGDRRTKRGKLFRGTFGKRRPKPQKVRKKAKAAASSQ